MGSSKSGSVTVGYRYYFDIHMGLGLPIDELVAIRASNKVAWSGSITENGQIRINAPELFGGDDGEGGLDGTLDVMFGEEDQTVPGRLSSMLGGTTPAFRGFSSAFYSGLVTSLNPYPKKWEILRRGGNRLWGADGAWYPEKQFIWLADGQIKAMNPVHMLYMSYTSPVLQRRAWPREWMDDAGWKAAADRCYEEAFGLCMEWKRSDSMSNFRDAIKSHIGAEVFDDRFTGLCNITLLRDDYDPESLPLFDADSGLLEVIDDESAGLSESPSELIIKYVDAIDGKTKAVRAANSAVAARSGGGSVEVMDYPGLPTGELAGRVLQRDLRIKTSGLKRLRVILDRRGRDLNIGQPFRVRSTKRGIDQIVLRVGRIEDGTLDDGRITITAVQDVFGMPSTSFVTVPPAGWAAPDRTPAVVSNRQVFEAPYLDLVNTAVDQPIDSLESYIATVAEAPNGMQFSYTLNTRPAGGSFADHGTAAWVPTAVTDAQLLPGESTVMLSGGSRLDEVAVGSVALLGSELVRVDSLDDETGLCELGRGCGDTVPALHAPGTRIWFYSDNVGSDGVTYSVGGDVDVRMLPNTSTGRLDPGLANTDTVTLQGRHAKPYPPGDVRLNGQSYPVDIQGELTVSWTHRDRLLQNDQVVDATVGHIGPEPGTTYTLRIYGETDTLIREVTGIEGAGYTYFDDWERGDSNLEVELVPAPAPAAIILEDGAGSGGIAIELSDAELAQRHYLNVLGHDGQQWIGSVGMLRRDDPLGLTGDTSTTEPVRLITSSDAATWSEVCRYMHPRGHSEKYLYIADARYYRIALSEYPSPDDGICTLLASDDLSTWAAVAGGPTIYHKASVIDQHVFIDSGDLVVLEAVESGADWLLRRWVHDGTTWTSSDSDPLPSEIFASWPWERQDDYVNRVWRFGDWWFFHLKETPTGGQWNSDMLYYTDDWITIHRYPFIGAVENKGREEILHTINGGLVVQQQTGVLFPISIRFQVFDAASGTWDETDWPMQQYGGSPWRWFEWEGAYYWYSNGGNGDLLRSEDFVTVEDAPIGTPLLFGGYSDVDGVVVAKPFNAATGWTWWRRIAGGVEAPLTLPLPTTTENGGQQDITDPIGVVANPDNHRFNYPDLWLRTMSQALPWPVKGWPGTGTVELQAEIKPGGITAVAWSVFTVQLDSDAGSVILDVREPTEDLPNRTSVTASLAAGDTYSVSLLLSDIVDGATSSSMEAALSVLDESETEVASWVGTITLDLGQPGEATNSPNYRPDWNAQSVSAGIAGTGSVGQIALVLNRGSHMASRLNDSLRVELFSVRDGVESWQEHNISVDRTG